MVAEGGLVDGGGAGISMGLRSRQRVLVEVRERGVGFGQARSDLERAGERLQDLVLDGLGVAHGCGGAVLDGPHGALAVDRVPGADLLLHPLGLGPLADPSISTFSNTRGAFPLKTYALSSRV